METAKIWTGSKAEAIERLGQLRGWDTARIEATTYGGYIIVGHSADCICGMCPILHDDGFFA